MSIRKIAEDDDLTDFEITDAADDTGMVSVYNNGRLFIEKISPRGLIISPDDTEVVLKEMARRMKEYAHVPDPD